MKSLFNIRIAEVLIKLSVGLRIFLLMLIFACGSLYSTAQREKNNIYLFDCTGSMISNKLWEPAKTSLDETVKLDATIPGSHVTIIPFGDEPYEVFTFEAKDYPREQKSIFNSFNKHIKEAKYTHISDVMEKGLKYIDNNKDNRIYLLTDGQPNHNDSPEKVAQVISRWCSIHKNSRLFYVALTKGALDDKIRKALEDCPDAYIVEIEGNVIPQFADLSSNIYTNLEELAKPREVEFSLPGEYDMRSEANDSLFDVRIVGDKASDGKILVTLVPKFPLEIMHQKLQGQEYTFPVSITTADRRYYVVNPDVKIHVSDEIPSKLSLAKGNDELAVKGAKWHDSFLWSPSAPEEQITWNLEPVFENQFRNSALKVKFKVPDGSSEDFDAWYNGIQIKNGEVLNIEPGGESQLTIQFNHDAKRGKRYFELIPVNYAGLDMINDQPAEEYEGTTLRTGYYVGWNPLATVLLWIGIAILAILVIWFLFLQRFFYPRIKVGKVEFTGPNSYYQSKKIKGARKIVLTSKKKKQNAFSKFFTGEVRYVKADHFSPELEITPASGKKKVKVSNSGKSQPAWDIYPSSIFQPFEKGELKNRNSKESTTIEFS